MTIPRRRLVRPAPPARQQHPRLLQRRQSALERERAALARWTARLKFAFHAFERCQKKVARLEKQTRQTEETG
jgi:hypothetical protein